MHKDQVVFGATQDSPSTSKLDVQGHDQRNCVGAGEGLYKGFDELFVETLIVYCVIV